jgi:hypothetical protein
LAYIANGVLQQLGYKGAVPFLGADCIPIPHVPLPASVHRYMYRNAGRKADWEIANPRVFHLPTMVLSRADYLLRVVAHLRAFSREQMMARLRDHHVLPFLQRLAIAAPALPRIEIWRKAA